MNRNWRALLLEKLAGGGRGNTLFVPRLDIWYNHKKKTGTLPESLKEKSLLEVTRSLGIGYHSVIPDYVHDVPLEQYIYRGLGYYNHPDFPFVFDFSDVEYEADIGEEEIRLTYHASQGDIVLAYEYGEEFLEKGNSIPAMHEHPIKSEADYDLLKDILSRVQVTERLSGYTACRNRIGEDGLAVCCTSLAPGPVGHIHRDLRRMDDFFLDQYDFPHKIMELTEVIAPHHEKLLEIAAKTEAEVVIYGANYDEAITIEPLFREHFMPWLVNAGTILHDEGKYLLTHTDGENQGLMEAYQESNFDIADSVTPAPMTKMSLKEYRECFNGNVNIWGGIPSTIMVADSFGWEDFKAWVERMLEETAPYDHLILSIADTCPPGADFGRIEYLYEKLNKGI
jgi:hypothetical protein